jgi:hypothetical protein
MKVSLDIKMPNGNDKTKDIVVNDENHLNNYISKIERNGKASVVGVHYNKDEDSVKPETGNEVWMGMVDCGKYSIEVIGRSEREVWKSLRKYYEDGCNYEGRSLEEQMEWSGGFVQKMEFGKIYFDGFRE